MILPTPRSTLFPYTTLFRSPLGIQQDGLWQDPIFNEDFNPDFVMESKGALSGDGYIVEVAIPFKSLRYEAGKNKLWGDRKSTRLNSSHANISYAVFCLKKKK